jgi:hypothetical protein
MKPLEELKQILERVFELAEARTDEYGTEMPVSSCDEFLSALLAAYEQDKWKPYPENKPKKGEYWIQLINGNNEACDYASPAGWQGRINNEVVAYCELPEPYKPEMKDERDDNPPMMSYDKPAEY